MRRLKSCDVDKAVRMSTSCSYQLRLTLQGPIVTKLDLRMAQGIASENGSRRSFHFLA